MTVTSNSVFRDELLYREWFASLDEAQVPIERWRTEYNQERPHGSLDYQTLREYADAYDVNPTNPNDGGKLS